MVHDNIGLLIDLWNSGHDAIGLLLAYRGYSKFNVLPDISVLILE